MFDELLSYTVLPRWTRNTDITPFQSSPTTHDEIDLFSVLVDGLHSIALLAQYLLENPVVNQALTFRPPMTFLLQALVILIRPK